MYYDLETFEKFNPQGYLLLEDKVIGLLQLANLTQSQREAISYGENMLNISTTTDVFEASTEKVHDEVAALSSAV